MKLFVERVQIGFVLDSSHLSNIMGIDYSVITNHLTNFADQCIQVYARIIILPTIILR